ncbi:hypothetical protein OAF13_03970, partial [Akkermansiaceae bacterium]|nr:hypothetical protein [Akkermansiaceae bacterium]
FLSGEESDEGLPGISNNPAFDIGDLHAGQLEIALSDFLLKTEPIGKWKSLSQTDSQAPLAETIGPADFRSDDRIGHPSRLSMSTCCLLDTQTSRTKVKVVFFDPHRDRAVA